MKSAKEQLESLTHSWYGAAVLASALSYLTTSAGLIGSLVGLAIGIAITAFVGNRLVAGSSTMRLVCMVFGVLGILGHSYATYRAVAGPWGLSAIGAAAISVIYVVMNFRSLRVLTNADVRAHFKA